MLRQRYLAVTCYCQVIIAYGLTGRTTPLGLSSISSLWPEGAPFRERSGGGPAAIGPIIGKKFHITPRPPQTPNPVQLH